MVTATSHEIPVAGHPDIDPTRQARPKGTGLNRHSAPDEWAPGSRSSTGPLLVTALAPSPLRDGGSGYGYQWSLMRRPMRKKRLLWFWSKFSQDAERGEPTDHVSLRSKVDVES